MIADVLGRVLVRLIRRVGITTLLSLILLGLAIGIVANGLAGMIRNLDSGPFWLVITGGLLFGWLLAKSRLPGWLAGLAAVVLGAGLLFIQVGRLELKLISAVRVYLHLSGEIWWAAKISPHHLNTIDTTQLDQAIHPLVDGFKVLFLRTSHWCEALVAGRASYDPIAVALVWGCGLWIATVWAAWFVRRSDRVFLGILPAGGMYAYILFYTGMSNSLTSLIIMMGVVFLLYALRSYAVFERVWQSVDLDRVHSPLELGVTVVSLTGVLMLVAALLPSISIRQVVNLFNTITSERAVGYPGVAESLGLNVRPEPTTVFGQAKIVSLPNQKLIAPGKKLSKEPVMHVSIAGYDPSPGATMGIVVPKVPPRYYWRSFTYDQYSGRGWYTSPVNVIGYSPNISGTLYLDSYHLWVQQKVYPLTDLGGFIYATGELQKMDAAYQVAWRDESDALAAQSESQVYTAVSSVPSVTAAELRSAGTEYPDWVTHRYLHLPSRVPDRVRSLAFDLTAVQPTPYDQTLAIEAYLRTISYTLDVPAPPPGRDVADYFLFDLKRGYCDYFATAMVVLARSAGIPARLVTGYASGEYDVRQAQFVVLEEDAHSWVEVYFPHYGWVEFEPTSGLPPIDRAGESWGLLPNYSPSFRPYIIPPLRGTAPRQSDLTFWAFALLVVISTGGLVWMGVESWRTWRMTPEMLVIYVYRGVYRQGYRLGLPSQSGETPREYSERLGMRVANISLPDYPLKDAVRARRERWIRLINRDLHTLTRLYEQAFFSSMPLETQDKANAKDTWRSLRQHLRSVWWVGGWRVWLHRPPSQPFPSKMRRWRGKKSMVNR